MEARLLSFSERRLAGLLRRAALQHVRRELRDAQATLEQTLFLVERSGRAGWLGAVPFLRAWSEALGGERESAACVAPAAWIHLAQELASLVESGTDWVGYLENRWRLESAPLGWTRRLALGAAGALALLLSGLVSSLLLRHLSLDSGEALTVGGFRSPMDRALTLLLLFGRVAGVFLLAEQGIGWLVRAYRGREDEPRVLFLGAPEGLALVVPDKT